TDLAKADHLKQQLVSPQSSLQVPAIAPLSGVPRRIERRSWMSPVGLSSRPDRRSREALQFPHAPPTCPATSPDRERPDNLPESSYLAAQVVWGPVCTRNKLPRMNRGLCQLLRVSKSR